MKIRLTDFVMVIVTIATFTSLVLPPHEFQPTLFGIPFSLWLGLLISAIHVGLAWILSRIQKRNQNDH